MIVETKDQIVNINQNGNLTTQKKQLKLIYIEYPT